MKNVRIVNNIVAEILPEEANPVKEWYNEQFAKECVEAPDEVEQNWYYDAKNNKFYNPEDLPVGTSGDPTEILLDAIIR